MLVESEAGVKLRGGFGGNASDAAAWSGDEAIVSLLFDHEADVTSTDYWAKCALHMSVLARQKERPDRELACRGHELGCHGSRTPARASGSRPIGVRKPPRACSFNTCRRLVSDGSNILGRLIFLSTAA